MSYDFSQLNLPNNTVSEDHYFFERDGRHLFRVDYIPEGEAKSCVVLCGPYAEEKVRTQRIYVSMARALAQRGVAAVCFDYFGDGDSEGEFEAATFEDRLADIKAVYYDIRTRTSINQMGLLGLRWGGTLATLAAEELKPNALVLWEPIVDAAKYFKDHLRSNLASQMLTEGKVVRTRDQLIEDLRAGEIITVEGYNLTGDFFLAASEGTLKGKDLRGAEKSLLMPIARNPERIRPEYKELQAALNECELAAVPREFEWEKTDTWCPAPPQLFGKTLDFLKSNGFY